MDIKIKIVPNPLYGRPGSLVESPYIAQVVHTGTVTAADICEACKKENPQMTEPLASLATETIMDYGSDKVVTDVVRFNLGSAFFTMEPAVTGSVPTVDAPLSDENERYIKVVNGQSLNARIAALRPIIVNDDLGDVQFRSIETVEGEECFRNEIHGSGEFVALGKRLGGSDQKLQLFAKDGTLLSEATYVDSDLLGQRFTYRLATPPANDVIGNLVLSSTGKDTPERNPKTISHEVKYLRVVDPPTKRVTLDTLKAVGDDVYLRVTGENLDGTLGYSVDETSTRHVTFDMFVNGEGKGPVELTGSVAAEGGAVDLVGAPAFSAGDTVKLVAHPDPAKTDFVQEDAVIEVTAE